jgi:hypothetical protein
MVNNENSSVLKKNVDFNEERVISVGTGFEDKI